MTVLKRLLKMLLPYKFLSILALLMIILYTSIDYIIPFILRDTIDKGIYTKDMETVVRYILIIAGLTIVRSVFAYLQGFLIERTGQKIAYDLRNNLYEHIQKLSSSFFDKHQTGQIMARMTGDIESVREFLGFGFINLFFCLFNFSVTVGLYIWVSWRLALFVIMPVPFLIILLLLFGKKVHPAWERIREEMGKLTTVIQENISGIRVVKAFSREEYEKGKFNESNKRNLKENLSRAKLESEFFPVMDFLGGSISLLLICAGGYYVIKGHISVGTFTALQWFVYGLVWPIRFSGWLVNVMQQAIAAAPRIFEILDAEPEVLDLPESVELTNAKGCIVFDNVGYYFPDGQLALKNINLTIKPGERVAVVGGTGSGKSTLLGLIPRFFDPSQGSIKINGIDIKNIKLENLRSHIGIVMQEPFLFSDTIRENIAYGKPDATQDEIEKAAKISKIHNFIKTLPRGYQTRVGERGIGLSGGQKQRISIARAILRDPDILLFDEATSSVDTTTEREIQASLNEIMKGRTSIIIAQRLSTIKNVDRIVVMDKGEIVDTGTHEELIKTNGYYSTIYHLQFKDQDLFAN
ncbi:MAG TPA: ABC transporter ATP-binding protein [Clostridiaceae bacterium]|nr:ABC transporter ATP-binding protein [Clostridiaceae bacterium]